LCKEKYAKESTPETLTLDFSFLLFPTAAMPQKPKVRTVSGYPLLRHIIWQVIVNAGVSALAIFVKLNLRPASPDVQSGS
jgi:hypothetical protein